MTSASEEFRVPRSAVGVLIGFGLLSCGLLILGRRDYAQVHTILDTSMTLMSGVLMLVLWDMGTRTDAGFVKQLALGFAATFLLELVHVLVTVEWAGPFAAAVHMHDYLRPVTWPPAAYCLPIGILGAIWLQQRGRSDIVAYAIVMAVVCGILLDIFRRVPPYLPPGPLGITRPSLVLVPVLWVAVGWLCGRRRKIHRVYWPLAIMACVYCCGAVAMTYSRAPHDTQAMVAHLAKACGSLVLLLSLMRMAASDMLERVRAEDNLARLNEQLEHRVHDRTMQLESANTLLEQEVGERRQAERRAQEQLRRVDLLHHVIQAIGERRDLNGLLRVVVGSVEEQLPADLVCVVFHDTVDNRLAVVSAGRSNGALASRAGLAERTRVEIDDVLSRSMAGELLYEADLAKTAAPHMRKLAAAGLGSAVLAPLRTESQVFGILLVARLESSEFQPGEREFLQQLGDHLALVVHQAHM